MAVSVEHISNFARQLEINVCLELTPELLVPKKRIRELCQENKCGNYGGHYMCPPRVGSLEEIKARLLCFQRGLLLQYSRPIRVGRRQQDLRQSKLDFHHKVLQLEEFLRAAGIRDIWGMVGGSCELCEICQAKLNEACPYPEKARTSLVAIAVNVIALLNRFQLDVRFDPERVTWTGCILFKTKVEL
jgi:predicted metal-binding protein